MMGFTVVILGCLVAYVAYWVGSIPVPRGFRDPWFLRLVLSVLKLAGSVRYFKEFYNDPKDVLIGIRNSKLAKPQKVNLPVKKEDREISGVKVRIFTPEGLPAGSNPGIVYYHGGGWCLGSVDISDGLCQYMARDVGAVVISVEYRLAPEHPYPAPLDDCVTAVTYVIKNPEQFGVDPNRICIAGESAGGNLTAATALRLRDANIQPQPKLQVLAFPCLQSIDMNSPSYMANKDDPLLNRRTMALFWLLYATGQSKHLDDMVANNHTTRHIKEKITAKRLNHEDIFRGYSARNYNKTEIGSGDEKIWKELESVFTDPYFAPLMADDVKNLPEALVLTAEQDVLRDDGIWYARHLKEAGVKVNHIHDNAAVHAMTSLLFNKPNLLEVREMLFSGIKSKL